MRYPWIATLLALAAPANAQPPGRADGGVDGASPKPAAAAAKPGSGSPRQPQKGIVTLLGPRRDDELSRALGEAASAREIDRALGDGSGIAVGAPRPPRAPAPPPSTLDAELARRARSSARGYRPDDEAVPSRGEANPGFGLRLSKGRCYAIVIAAAPGVTVEEARLMAPNHDGPVARSTAGATIRYCARETYTYGLLTTTSAEGPVAVRVYRR